MKEIKMKITNAKQLVEVIRDIIKRSEEAKWGDPRMLAYRQNLLTLIKVLEEAK